MHGDKTKFNRSTDVYLVNTFGETQKFFNISKSVFLGGSIINHGGHNPIEPSHFLCALIVGPGVKNFTEIFQEFFSNNAAIQINNHQDLFKTILSLLKNQGKRKKIGMSANRIAENKSKILKDIYLLLKPFLKNTSLQKDNEIANT